MADTIEVEVGSLHAGLDEQLREILGDQYEESMRNEVEDLIHQTYRQVERSQEQQEEQELGNALSDTSDEE